MPESRYRDLLQGITQAPSEGFSIEVFRGEGVIVSLNIKRWRGKAKLESDELGLQEELLPQFREFMGKYIGLGQKLLLPKDYDERIKAVEVTARGNLKEYAYDSPWGAFIPFTSYDAFMDINESCREKFFALRDEIDEAYDEILDTIEQDYATLAVVVYKRTQNIPLGQVTKAPREFVDAFLQSVMSQIPPRKKIYESFIFETKFMSIPDIMVPLDTAGEDEVLPNGRSKAEVREAAQEQVRRTVLGEGDENLESFLDTVVSHLRELARDGSEGIVASIDRNDGKLVGRTSVRARNLVKKIRLKDFYGDAKLREYVDRLEALLAAAPEERSVIEIRSAFVELGNYSSTSLEELATVRRAAGKGGGAGTTVIPVSPSGRKAKSSRGNSVTIPQAESGRSPKSVDPEDAEE